MNNESKSIKSNPPLHYIGKRDFFMLTDYVCINHLKNHQRFVNCASHKLRLNNIDLKTDRIQHVDRNYIEC